MAFAPKPGRLALAVAAIAATAALVWFGTGLNPLWPLLWFAPLPVLIYAGNANRWSTAAVAFAGWLIGDLNLWVYLRNYIEMPLGVVIGFVVVFALVFTAAVLLYRALLRRGSPWFALLAFPATWVTFEYLLNLAWQNGTAANLAYTQLSFLPFLQLASVTGPWGMSFLVLLFPAAIATLVCLRRHRPRSAWSIAGTSCAVIAAVLIFGTVRLTTAHPSATVPVGLVASDAAGTGMVKPGAPAMRLFREYGARIRTLAEHGAKVVVLPEKVAIVNHGTRPAVNAMFQALSNQYGAIIAVGVADVNAKNVAYNEAWIFRPHKRVLAYAKHHLLMPFESVFTPGRTLTTFVAPGGRWGVEICKDMDFTQLSRKYGRLGVALMLVPGLDFDIDRGFHGHMAIMRGVESGFAVARSARHGYLTESDDRGRILGQIRSDAAPFATVLVSLPVRHDSTVFLAWGNWFAWVAIAVLAATLLRLLQLFVAGVRMKVPA